MNDRAVAVFGQYDFEVNSTRKGRGAIIAETDKGIFSLCEYAGREDRLLLGKKVLDRMEASGFSYVDNYVPNKEGGLSVLDYEGKKYVVKRYIEGRECNANDESECMKLAGEIASMHRIMEFGGDFLTELSLCNVEIPAGSFCKKESEEEESASKEPDQSRFRALLKLEEDTLVRDFSKRELELHRARTFMRKQARKGDFELLFLREYPYFEQRAREAEACLSEECLKKLRKEVLEKGMFCHGECNQHTMLLGDGHMAAVCFEKTGPDIQVRDLYLFLRKILEKNKWSFAMGMKILSAYERVKPLNDLERRYLYARILYPERYWKIANAYLNKRKSLPPRRQMEKLRALLQLEVNRNEFLQAFAQEWQM